MYSLGIDVGTSGIRAVIMDSQQNIHAQAQSALPASQTFFSQHGQVIGYFQNPFDWWKTLETVLFQLARELQLATKQPLTSVSHLAIDGTSGTILFADRAGIPCSDALMYNDQRAVQQAKIIKTYASENTAAIGATSGLAKLLWLYENGLFEHKNSRDSMEYVLNQSDWLSSKLMGKFGQTDHNNALKMGYDAERHCWPDWLTTLLENQRIPVSSLPEVFIPGQTMGSITTDMAHHFGFDPSLQICAGTTDSTAAIIASGAKEPGEAVTSLGSTLVMKVISQQPIYEQSSGVYSQPYGDLWLVGGGSNSGGEVLKQFFSPGELTGFTESLTRKIALGQFALLNLNYYPLLSSGERFPIQDPNLVPRLLPRPAQNIDFFQALLEGMSDIETIAYQRLLELGAPYPKCVISIGGGAFNKAWRNIREKKIGVPVLLARQDQAAAGSAILAQTMWH